MRPKNQEPNPYDAEEGVDKVIKDMPDICGNEDEIEQVMSHTRDDLYIKYSDLAIDQAKSAFGIALHMHQPTIPASSDDLAAAELISNLQFMMEHQDMGDNHNAPVFLWCYSRMSEFVRELRENGKDPRAMLDYSGNLLWGL